MCRYLNSKTMSNITASKEKISAGVTGYSSISSIHLCHAGLSISMLQSEKSPQSLPLPKQGQKEVSPPFSGIGNGSFLLPGRCRSSQSSGLFGNCTLAFRHTGYGFAPRRPVGRLIRSECGPGKQKAHTAAAPRCTRTVAFRQRPHESGLSTMRVHCKAQYKQLSKRCQP